MFFLEMAVYHGLVLPKTDPRGRPRLPESVSVEVLKMREAGASIVDIARTLGIGVGSVHRIIVADMKQCPPAHSTSEAGSPNSEAGPVSADTPDSTRASTTESNGGK